jgi:uncharacterized protein
MVNNSKEAFEIITKLSREFFPESRILLFGSRARNENTDYSDYDFLIVTKEMIDIHKKRFYLSLLRKKLAKHKIPADILIQSELEIHEKKLIPGHIIRQIIKDGIAL